MDDHGNRIAYVRLYKFDHAATKQLAAVLSAEEDTGAPPPRPQKTKTHGDHLPALLAMEMSTPESLSLRSRRLWYRVWQACRGMCWICGTTSVEFSRYVCCTPLRPPTPLKPQLILYLMRLIRMPWYPRRASSPHPSSTRSCATPSTPGAGTPAPRP